MLQLVDVSVATIGDYAPLVGEDVVARLERLASSLKGARILHVNATAYGGGVSELLRSSVSIQHGLGLDVEWRVISGSEGFFEVTKNIHNALQGADYELTAEAKETFLLQNSYNAQQMEGNYDFVVIHDPQPAAILHLLGHDSRKWVWRCHIDTSHPNEQVLQFFLPFINEYDALVFTLDQFVPDALRDRAVYLIPPGIDPLSPKNFEIPDDHCRRIMAWVGVQPKINHYLPRCHDSIPGRIRSVSSVSTAGCDRRFRSFNWHYSVRWRSMIRRRGGC